MAWIAPAIGAGIGLLANRSKGPGQQQVQVADPWAPTIPYLSEMLSRIQGYSNTPSPYGTPQEMVAPLTPEQQAARQTVGQGVQGAAGTVGQAQQGISPFLSGQFMNVENNPYLQAAIGAATRPITQNYQENVLPSISSAFNVGTDAYNQSREGIAQGIASRGYLDAISGVSANMANRGYETGLGATQASFGQVPGLTTAATAPGQAQWNIGALLQAHEQNLASAPGAFDQMQQQRLAFPANLYTQVGQIGRQGTTTSPGVQGNPWLGALGGAIAGQQIYNMWPQQQRPTQGGGGGYEV